MKKNELSLSAIIGGAAFAIAGILILIQMMQREYTSFRNLQSVPQCILCGVVSYVAITQRKNTVLPICFSFLAFLDLYDLLIDCCYYYRWMSFTNILHHVSLIVANALTAYICFGKFTDILKKYYKKGVAKLWFLPAILILLFKIIYPTFKYHYHIELSDLSPIIAVIGYTFIGIWVATPAVLLSKTSSSIDKEVDSEAYCDLLKHILLCLFTFGVWQYLWIWRTTKFLNKAPNAEEYNPTNKLLLCMFVPFYLIYWLYKHGQRIDIMYKDKNLGNSEIATLCLILGIFIPIVAYIIMQDKINAICTISENTVEVSVSDTQSMDFENLEKLKKLLDGGIITQEEFEQKKKQLLNL